MPRWSRISIVRECRPPAREPTRSWVVRRSTIATSTPANASSPANISPVGPPPAITTAWLVIATLGNNSLISGPRRFWLQPAFLRDDRGLEASPLRPTYLSGEGWYLASGYFGGRPNLNDSLIDRITAAPRGFFRGPLSRGRDGNRF